MEGDKMDTLPVTLIVKAPNQQIEDQTIKCELTWSINRLKEHLSEVYPNKPPRNEQKLIYSGQLLNDSIILKDVLREYGGTEGTHTLHLVCTPKYSNYAPSTPVARQAAAAAPNTPEAPPATATTSNVPGSSNTDERVPNLDWYNNAQYNMQQFMMMQQTYVQYMQHYMNFAHMQQFGAPMPGHPLHTHYEYDTNLNPTLRYRNNAAGVDHHPEHQHLNAPGDLQVPQPGNNDGGGGGAVPPAVAAGAQQPDAQGQGQEQGGEAAGAGGAVQVAPPQQMRGIALADERDHRDWLDHFYMVCRVMIFISIVYFYSSATRFIVVFFTAVCLYLYQIGFFRHVNINNNNNIGANDRRRRAAAAAAAAAAPARAEGEAPPAEGAEVENNPEGGEEALRRQETEPSRLTVAWTFVTTFLASLLPEIPNVV